MKDTIRKPLKWIGRALVLAVVLLAILMVGVRLIGFQVYAVLSSSMEPTYHTGSLLYVRKTDPAEIEVGTPITFLLNPNTVATHRVVEVLEDETDPGTRLFRTKGDANEVADGSAVHQRNVLGVPKFSIPYLGYFAVWIQNPPGKYIVITVCASILLLAFLPDLFRDEGKKEQEGSGKEDEAEK